MPGVFVSAAITRLANLRLSIRGSGAGAKSCFALRALLNFIFHIACIPHVSPKLSHSLLLSPSHSHFHWFIFISSYLSYAPCCRRDDFFNVEGINCWFTFFPVSSS